VWRWLSSDLSVTSWQLVTNKLATSPTSPRGNVTDKSRRVASCRVVTLEWQLGFILLTYWQIHERRQTVRDEMKTCPRPIMAAVISKLHGLIFVKWTQCADYSTDVLQCVGVCIINLGDWAAERHRPERR